MGGFASFYMAWICGKKILSEGINIITINGACEGHIVVHICGMYFLGEDENC